jgi:hypothetical protein
VRAPFDAVHRFKPFIAKAKIDIQNHHSPHSLKLQFSKSVIQKRIYLQLVVF